jgi:integrase
MRAFIPGHTDPHDLVISIEDTTALRSLTGERSERLRFSVVHLGDPHLAGKRSEDVRAPEAPAARARVNQFRRLRRSHSTLHKQRNSDLKIIADQQGHGMRTHLDNYVQSGVAERKAEASKLYADFIGVLRKRG